MSVASVESIPDRFNALYDYEVLHMPKTQISKKTVFVHLQFMASLPTCNF